MLWRHRSSFDDHIASWYIFIAIIFIRAMFSYLCYTKSFLTFSKSSTFLPFSFKCCCYSYLSFISPSKFCMHDFKNTAFYILNKCYTIKTKYIHPRKKQIRQSKEIKQNWAGLKNFNICFCIILNCYNRSFISGRDIGH